MKTKSFSLSAVLSIALPLASGCGLITINGKPLGTKKSETPGSTAADSGSGSTTNSDEPGTKASNRGSSPAKNNTGQGRAVVDAGNAANTELFEAVKADKIPADTLAALQAAATKAGELGETKSAAFFSLRVYAYRFVQAMLALDAGDEGPLAELMAGTIESKGVSGKQLKVSLKLKRDRCYQIALKWKAPSGTEELRDYAWTASKPQAIQRYFTRFTHSYLPWSFGMCATADTSATFTAEFRASGSKPRLQYAVVSWPRDEVPGDALLYASVVPPDKCSSTAWKNLWLDPIPGTVVYRKTEPYLLTGVSHGTTQVTMHNTTGKEGGGHHTQMTDAPEGAANVRAQFSMPRCSGSKYAASAVSKKAAKCHEAIDAKYDKQFAAAERARDGARTVGALRAAEAKLDRLRSGEGNARRSQCGAVDKKLEADVEKTFNEIVDHFNDNSPEGTDRMKRLHPE